MDIINIGRLLAMLVLLCCIGAGVWLYFHHTDLQNAWQPLALVISFAGAAFGYLALAERTA
jgi:membrane protein YdbS with pleckstrin-like domain